MKLRPAEVRVSAMDWKPAQKEMITDWRNCAAKEHSLKPVLCLQRWMRLEVPRRELSVLEC